MILLKDQVIGFKEKPKTVVSVYAVPPFYIFNRKDINEIKKLKGHYESLGNILEEVVGGNSNEGLSDEWQQIGFGKFKSL